MDGAGFDNLTKAFAISRRQVLKRFAAGAIGAAAGVVGLGGDGAFACEAFSRRCTDGDECCSGACDPGSGRCACPAGTEECSRACYSPGDYAADPDNCGGCRVRCRRAPECQIPACLDGVCGGVPDPRQIGQRCGRGSGVCLADGSCGCPAESPTSCRRGCVNTLTDPANCGACENRCPNVANGEGACQGGVCKIVCDADYHACGDGCCAADRSCCAGTCCRPGECCDGNGACSREACAPHCTIGGAVFPAGTINPSQGCQICDPARSETAWSIVDDFAVCGGVAGRVCCNGECCSPTECCNPTGYCEECGPLCRIGGRDVDAGEANPNNRCQICDPERDPLGWSSAFDGEICGGDLDDELVCCSGVCCGLDQCCRGGACGPCGCTIDGRDFEHGEPNPSNACEYCDPARDRTGWTASRNNSPCGLSGGRSCCEGVCCAQGDCCNQIGECAPCGCTIAGLPYEPGDVNPSNTCQVCDPDRDREAWTLVADGGECGDSDDDRVCCGGLCCERGACCVDGACQPCGCEIDGQTYAAGSINPDNSCQVCQPTIARLAWSPVFDDTPCGGSGEQVCCEGVCCGEELCCLVGACGTCLCVIDGDNYAVNAPNPANPCERCDPDQDPFGWAEIRDNEACGLDRICCAGSCCAEGECCTLGLCGFCGCEIDGVRYDDGQRDPANECRVCDPVLDRFGWSVTTDDAFCGASGAHVCCAGVCCPAGHCCSLEGACEPCRCEIDGVLFDAGQMNPANECETCLPAISTTSWSPRPDDSPCGANLTDFCCDGSCGGCGSCEIAGVVYRRHERNPANACELCDPAVDSQGWTGAPDHAKCGDDLNQVCCSGVCCADRTCCRSSSGTCSIEWCGMTDPCTYEDPCGCTIDGVFHPHRTINPDNECQWCDAYFSTTAWVTRGDFTRCGPFEDRFCCSDVCCESGACCNAQAVCESDAPSCRGCVIGGRFLRNLKKNPDNPCQICDRSRSSSAWSDAPNHQSCGQMVDEDGIYWGNLLCCEGVCCTDWYSCCRADGTCGQGPCPPW